MWSTLRIPSRLVPVCPGGFEPPISRTRTERSRQIEPWADDRCSTARRDRTCLLLLVTEAQSLDCQRRVRLVGMMVRHPPARCAYGASSRFARRVARSVVDVRPSPVRAFLGSPRFVDHLRIERSASSVSESPGSPTRRDPSSSSSRAERESNPRLPFCRRRSSPRESARSRAWSG